MSVTVPDTVVHHHPVYHVVILHQKLRQKVEDRYLIDAALALQRHGHKVTIFTSFIDAERCYEEVHPKRGVIEVKYSGWWIPNSFFGYFRQTMTRIKSMYMALKLIFFPPTPKPTVAVLDIDSIALFFLGTFSNYKTLYFQHFSQLQAFEEAYKKFVHLVPDLVAAKSIQYADEVIVQTEQLRDVFKRSFVNFGREVKILTPCVDTGIWTDEAIDINRIIPDLPKNSYLFSCFGTFRRSSNFKLALNAFAYLYDFVDECLKSKIHLVIAGHCSERSNEQKIYYMELIDAAKEKCYASQITFLRQLPTIHKKSILLESVALVHTAKHDIFPGPITAAMCMGRPVIGTNTGFIKEAIVHRLTGILVEPSPEKFALAMYKVITKPAVQGFLGDMARDTFMYKYCFGTFCRKLNDLVLANTVPDYDCIKDY